MRQVLAHRDSDRLHCVPPTVELLGSDHNSVRAMPLHRTQASFRHCVFIWLTILLIGYLFLSYTMGIVASFYRSSIKYHLAQLPNWVRLTTNTGDSVSPGPATRSGTGTSWIRIDRRTASRQLDWFYDRHPSPHIQRRYRLVPSTCQPSVWLLAVVVDLRCSKPAVACCLSEHSAVLSGSPV